MPINMATLPSSLLDLFLESANSLYTGITVAMGLGYTNPNSLTDIVFFARHPERNGAALKTFESLLIKEWKEIYKEVVKVLRIAPRPAPKGVGPLWLQYAQQEEASWSVTKESYVDTDEQYFMASPFYGHTSHTDGTIPKSKNLNWCAAFVNWCLHRAGYSHTGSAGDGSFKNSSDWHFDALSEPKQGCVIVLGNTKDQKNSNHVTFLWDWKNLPTGTDVDDVWVSGAKRCYCLGGNQSDRVQVTNFYNRKLFSARGKNGIRSPYLWPLKGPATCTIKTVPSAGAHFCGLNPV